jgi:hypothetical protein
MVVLLFVGAWSLLGAPAPAQWGVTAEVGVARFGGTSRDSSGASVRPYRPTTLGAYLDREQGPVRVQLGAAYAKTGIAGERDGVAYALYDLAWMVEVGLRASLAVAHLGAGVVVRLEAGPAVDLWSVEEEFRSRWAAWGGAAVEWPLGRRLTGALRASGALSRSMFESDEIPDGVDSLTTSRWGVSFALRYRL